MEVGEEMSLTELIKGNQEIKGNLENKGNQEYLEKLIKKYVSLYQEKHHTVTGWAEPLIAYAAARDPLFRKMKEVISSSHNLPTALIANAQTVISYFIPFNKEIVLSNIKDKKSSEAWAISYIETNRLIRELNEYIYAQLQELNYATAILPPTHNFDEQKLISDWSHKHVAYIAGLGKFGLHRMLITEKGCCGRLGSIVTELEIEPTKRSEEEYCLYQYNGTCKKCVERCINGALGIETYDRHKCYAALLNNVEHYSKIGYADVCGKCISQVPCSFVNPVKKH